MTEEEIIAGCKKGERLLEEYLECMQPVAQELARLKSISVFGEEGKYRGHLGCHEDGLNVVCLHIGGFAAEEAIEDLEKKIGERHIDFELGWLRKLTDVGVGKNIHISGHF